MLDEKVLQFRVITHSDSTPLDFRVQRIICTGYSGRNQNAVQEHVDELAAHGLPAPESTPIFFQVSHYLATTTTAITVQDRFTSGEVEFVLLFHEGEMFVTCGSDHTHRGLEKHSIPGAKQMHPKILAHDVWRFKDVEEHWDELVLRSYATSGGFPKLYQDAPLSKILRPEQLFRKAEGRYTIPVDGTIFMSGTIPTVGGRLVYADRFDFQLYDPVAKRRIQHAYDISVMD